MDLIARLNLAPHPEGGYFRETYRSAAGTAIYYLLQAGDASQWHRVVQDEIWHYYQGAPLRLRLLTPEGKPEEILLGPDHAQAVVPGGVWQGARPTGAFVLVGCTVSPAFTWADFELGSGEVLAEQFPAQRGFVLWE